MKKILSLVVFMGMLFCSVFAAYVDMPENAQEREALNRAVENGLLSGVSENEIAPYAPITRSQMSAILVRAMNAQNKGDISAFTDVSESAWYYDEMSRAVAMGAFKGDGGAKLYPDKDITYQEAFLVLSRVFDLRYENEAELKKFTDCADVASWAKDGVLKIVSGGYYTGDRLNPNGVINRVEFAKIMDKLVTTYIDAPGTYTSLPKGNILVRCDGVVFDGIGNPDAMSAFEGDIIIIGDSVKNTEIKNADGTNVALRGGSLKLSGQVGIVRTVCEGTVLIPDLENYGGKLYPNGSRGIISAAAEGSYISLE